MENKSLALEVGQRCRRFRNALGVSQQKLADMIGTTPQNISKYEKEGVHDIDIIRYLSSALGHDLMTDEIDEEGTVGEIGKEILDMLVNPNYPFNDEPYGCITADSLFDSSSLYGLPKDRIIKELFKLEKIGLCVREQYIDFYDNNKDDIFITSKGVITLKHIGNIQNQVYNYENVCTYEMRCEGYESYQAYIDSNSVEKIIRNIPVENGFRANFIYFIKKAYAVDDACLSLEKDYFPGVSAYVDIMYSMIMEVTRSKADHMITLLNESYSTESFDEFEKLAYEFDVNGKSAVPYRKLINELNKHINVELINFDLDEWINKKDVFVSQNAEDSELIEKQNRYQKMIEEDEELENALENAESHFNDMFMEKAQKYSNSCPLDWFSKEEIAQFITDNILEPQSEYEENIEKVLLQIKEMSTELVEGYFEFPKEWEINGLAALVRKIYKINK